MSYICFASKYTDEKVSFCVSTHHWQLVEVKQLFDEASEHVLTLPHLIQGPESKEYTKREEKQVRIGKNTGADQSTVHVICTYV